MNGAGHSLLADRMELCQHCTVVYRRHSRDSRPGGAHPGAGGIQQALGIETRSNAVWLPCRVGCPDGMRERRWVVLGRNRVAWDDRQRFETCRVEQRWVCMAISISQRPAVDRWTVDRPLKSCQANRGKQNAASRRCPRWACVSAGFAVRGMEVAWLAKGESWSRRRLDQPHAAQPLNMKRDFACVGTVQEHRH